MLQDDTIDLLPCGLTRAQKEAWDTTCSMMVLTAPGFTHLLYKLLSNNNGDYTAIFTETVPNAATDGDNILMNPAWYFDKKLTTNNRVFIMGHEIMHNVYNDIQLLHYCSTSGQVPTNDGASLPFDNGVLQRAMDYRINALLIETKIGIPPEEGNFSKEYTSADSVLDIYAREYAKKKASPSQSAQEGGDKPNPGGFDNLLPPGKSTGKDPETAAGERNPDQWAVEVAVSQQLEIDNRAEGKTPAGLLRMFKAILEPDVDWTTHIATLINRVTGSAGTTSSPTNGGPPMTSSHPAAVARVRGGS